MRKPQLSEQLPERFLRFDRNPHERFLFAPAFSERFCKNWGGPRARVIFGEIIQKTKETLKTQSIKKLKGGRIPLFLSPVHPYKRGGWTPKRPRKKKRGPKTKWGDENFRFFWKQQNPFCNCILKMKRTFSKKPEHPKIPRPGILSDLCLNFTVISV